MKKFIIILAITVCLAMGRQTFSGVTDDKEAAWVGSTEYSKSETHTENNVVVMAMGHKYPWAAGERPPFWAVAAARSEEAATGPDAKRFQLWQEALGVVMSYNGIADYCETNGIPGIQWKSKNASSNDRIIHFWKWNDAKWAQVAVSNAGNTTGGIYWGNITTTGEEFSLECRAGLVGAVDGLTIGQYEFKCDVHINSTKIWALTSDACADSNRFLALRAFFGGIVIDVNVDEGNINKTDAEGSGELNFGEGAWFKFKKVVALVRNRTIEQDIIPRICPITTEIALPSAVRVIREASFSFMYSKSSNPGVLEWDPVFGVDPTTFSASSSTIISLLLLLFVALLLAW